MVLVNCAALPSALVESELFGRERGAYTGALTSQVGTLRSGEWLDHFPGRGRGAVHGGPGKLLRVFQQGEFQRFGQAPKPTKWMCA